MSTEKTSGAESGPENVIVPYEITNPHDKAVLAAADLRVAAATVVLLGMGAYGLRREDGSTAMPVLLLGGGEEWFAEIGVADIGQFMSQRWTAIADCLDGIFYGTPAEWRAAQPMTAAERNIHNESRRSSMRNLADDGAHYARLLRQRYASEEAPQSE